MALAMRLAAGDHRHVSRLVETNDCATPCTPDQPFAPHARRGTNAADGDVGSDTDAEPLERWAYWRRADTAVVWDTHIGGIPVCLLGLESQTIPRSGFVPADGPASWTSGTLFPQSARKLARAINAASGNRPLVVLANLSGFDGSPESMRRWQLEYGAEIAHEPGDRARDLAVRGSLGAPRKRLLLHESPSLRGLDACGGRE